MPEKLTEEQYEALCISAEHACRDCDHASAMGYLLCNCCLHGTCGRASDKSIAARKAIAAHNGRPEVEPIVDLEDRPFTLNSVVLDDILEVTGRIVGSGFKCRPMMKNFDLQRYYDACVVAFKLNLEMHHCYSEEDVESDRRDFADSVEAARKELAESLIVQDLC